MRPSSKEINFTDLATAAIIAGRGFRAMCALGLWEQFFERLDQLAGELKLPLAIIVTTDLTSSSRGTFPWRLKTDEVWDAHAIVGLLVAATDDPSGHQVPWEQLQGAVDRATSIPWDKLATMIDSLLQPDSTLDDETALWVGATGPLAGFHLAYGVPALDESEELAWSAGSPQSQEPALEFVSGKDMDQHPVKEGIWGMDVASRADWGYLRLELNAAAHAEHRAMLGVLAVQASYYLMSCYD